MVNSSSNKELLEHLLGELTMELRTVPQKADWLLCFGVVLGSRVLEDYVLQGWYHYEKLLGFTPAEALLSISMGSKQYSEEY